ncbi:MAG: DsbA family protein [Myxococcota bacterium]
MMTRPIPIGWSLLVLGALLISGCAPGAEVAPETETSNPEATESPAVAAVINGEQIGVDRVDDQIRQELFEETFGGAAGAAKLYDARRETTENIIEEMLLAQAAGAAGQDQDTWLTEAQAALPEVSDAEVAEFFEENKTRLGADPKLEDFAPRILGFLEAQQGQLVFEQLYEDAEIQILLERERAQVGTNGASMGPENAPVTIVEFSDFQCPYCSRVVPTLKQIAAAYPEQVRIVYRHLPLDFHAQAKGAAQASVCADNQDNFWPFHDKLFENQRALEREQLVAYATELDLDIPTFEACLDDPKTVARVEADLAEARKLGATGTPAFYINGIMLSGAQPFENFDAVIVEELESSGG